MSPTVKTDLIIQANNLSQKLLTQMKELSNVVDAAKNDLNTWLDAWTEYNRINRILTKSIERCKRRSLI